MNKTDEASIKRIIKCYLLHHKEATAKELVQHITHNNYGIKKSLNPTGLSKHIKVWKHDNHSWFNIGTYKNNQNKTVYYLKE